MTIHVYKSQLSITIFLHYSLDKKQISVLKPFKLHYLCLEMKKSLFFLLEKKGILDNQF